MSSKEQKTPEGQAPEEIIMDQHEEIEAVEPEASAEQVDPRDEKIANLEAQLAEAQTRERDGILRVKAEMENLRRRTELDIEKAHKFALEKFINELLPVIDSLDRALEVADKANPVTPQGCRAGARQPIRQQSCSKKGGSFFGSSRPFCIWNLWCGNACVWQGLRCIFQGNTL